MYTIIKKIIEGIEIVGYVVSDEDGNEKSLKISDIQKLCYRDNISNARLINVNNEDTLIIDTDLRKLPSTSRSKLDLNLRLVCRLIEKDENGKEITKGYIVKDQNGKKTRVDNIRVWKLAYENRIEGIDADIINKKKVLKNRDTDILEKLPAMEDE